MAQAKMRHDWDCASHIVATVANIMRAKGQPPVSFLKCNPLRQQQPVEYGIEVLKQLVPENGSR